MLVDEANRSYEVHEPVRCSHKYLDVAGGIIHYLHYPNPGKPALLGLHGYLDNSSTFKFLEPLLLSKFELYLLDWRGHGDSSRLTEGYYSSSLFLGDLIDFTNRAMPETYCLMGHSMGASLAARLAGLFPEEIKYLILFEMLSPEKEFNELKQWALNFRAYMSSGKMLQHNSMNNFEEVMKNITLLHPNLLSDKLAILARALVRSDGKGASVWHHDPEIRLKFCQVPFPPELTRDLWRNVQCPVLLVFGDSSMLHPAIRLMGDLNENQEKGNKIRNMIGEFKDIEYHIIKSAGHNLHHDKPEIVMEIMESFLEKTSL